ncbi:hypothetical protein COO60DRAFT_1518553 [Scenedesmus sp. NREL 46B-D3]|nr:hypothetical protein COO60DRAFT_1518553 [Scenedesmus sp. NREL 46B-D3]
MFHHQGPCLSLQGQLFTAWLLHQLALVLQLCFGTNLRLAVVEGSLCGSCPAPPATVAVLASSCSCWHIHSWPGTMVSMNESQAQPSQAVYCCFSCQVLGCA